MPYGSKHAREITDKLVRFIVRDIRPLSVIEGKGFLEFFDVLNPQYQVPSRKTIMECLKDLYSEEKLQVKKKIDNAFAVALDFWTSRSVDSYLGVTVHFITEDWKLSSFILQTAEVKECHTITNIA